MKKAVLLLLALAFVSANAQEFQTFKAKQALKKYQSHLKKMEKLKKQGEDQYKRDLKIALKSAMQSNNLKEATLIQNTIDGEETNDSTDVEDVKNSKKKLKLKISDKHRGLIGKTNTDGVYLLVLRKAKRKKIKLIIDARRNIARDSSFGDITINGTKVGSWDLTNKKKEGLEFDITSIVVAGYAEYKIEFTYKGGGQSLVISEVKAQYK